jgi:uncharacterized membrane protein
MSKNLTYWKGPFYFNRKDPRLMVPKLYPLLGWTFNFASPYVYLTLTGIFLVIIATRYFFS